MDTLDLSLLIIRVGIGLTFAIHGAQKVFGWWGGPGLAGWQGAMQHMGYRPARLFALISALIEFGGGLLLAVGFATPLVAAALVAQVVVIIGQAHWANGFFNSKSGYEFPLMLGLAAAAVGIAGPGTVSADGWMGFAVDPALRTVLVVVALVAGLVTLVVPKLSRRAVPAAA